MTDFPRNRRARNGFGSYCKPCHNQITRRNRDKKGGARNYHLRRRYGITAEHFDRMLAEQGGGPPADEGVAGGGVCAICTEAPAEHVDHDHETGRVRGLLCFNCNGALGQFRDRTDLMLQAVAYLRRGDWQSAHELPGATVCFSIVQEDPDSAPPADAA